MAHPFTTCSSHETPVKEITPEHDAALVSVITMLYVSDFPVLEFGQRLLPHAHLTHPKYVLWVIQNDAPVQYATRTTF